MEPVVTIRYCRREHALIPGETAYTVARWTGREIFLPKTGGYIFVCDGKPPQRGIPCKHGGLEEHRQLEEWHGAGGTRVVGTAEGDGRTLWQHRKIELRCRACNRARVAQHRARQKQGR